LRDAVLDSYRSINGHSGSLLEFACGEPFCLS
jgi:hypothetical protein